MNILCNLSADFGYTVYIAPVLSLSNIPLILSATSPLTYSQLSSFKILAVVVDTIILLFSITIRLLII